MVKKSRNKGVKINFHEKSGRKKRERKREDEELRCGAMRNGNNS